MYISGNLGFERLRDPPNVTELLSSVWIEYGNFIFNVFPKLQENNPQSAVLKRKHSDRSSQRPQNGAEELLEVI